MRSFNGHPESICQQSRFTTVINMAMGQQNLLKLQAPVFHQSLQVVNIPTRVDQRGTARRGTHHQRTVLGKRRDRMNLVVHLAHLSQPKRVVLQIGQSNHLERLLMGRGQDHRRCHTGLSGLPPTTGADAPTISRLQAWESKLGPGRDQIVAMVDGEFEEGLGHHRTDRVAAEILRAGVAAAVTKKTREGFKTARLKFTAEHILCVGL